MPPAMLTEVRARAWPPELSDRVHARSRPCCAGFRTEKSRRSPLRFPQRLRRLSVRAIQDSNLWPLAPEEGERTSSGVQHFSTLHNLSPGRERLDPDPPRSLPPVLLLCCALAERSGRRCSRFALGLRRSRLV